MASTKFTKPFDESDISFSVEGKPIYASKTVMSMWSPVFKTMFSGGFKESKAKVVKLPEKRFDDILELVCALHPPNKPIDENNYEILLPLAHEYQMDGLLERIQEYLVRCQQPQPSIHKLFLAEEFSMPELKQQCIEFAKSSSLKTVIANEWFGKLSAELRAEILLFKAEEYFTILSDLKDIVNGGRPDAFRMCHIGQPGLGTQYKCSNCANFITEVLAKKLLKTTNLTVASSSADSLNF